MQTPASNITLKQIIGNLEPRSASENNVECWGFWGMGTAQCIKPCVLEQECDSSAHEKSEWLLRPTFLMLGEIEAETVSEKQGG